MSLARSHKDPMVRLMESVQEETLEVILERPLSGCELTFPGPGEGVSCLVHRTSDPAAPTLVELHGGGFALGDARKLDEMQAWACRAYGVGVVSVNYRLAPACPYPAALDDVRAVLRTLLEDPASVGLGSGPVYVMGYSAGANLALAASLAELDAGRRAPEALLLHYPFFDAATEPAEKGVREVDLPLDLMRAFNAWYVGSEDPHNPLISPLYCSDEQLARLPRTCMLPLAGDAMCAEAHELAARMAALGVNVSVRDVEDAYHGYLEDYANERVYREMNPASTISARPAGVAEAARRELVAGLDELLGSHASEAPSFM